MLCIGRWTRAGLGPGQFGTRNQVIRGVVTMAAFHPRALYIDANQVTIDMDLPTESGVVKARPGDWIVRDELGRRFVYTDELFRQLYERVGDRIQQSSLAEEGRSYGC